MFTKQTVKDINLEGKTVLLRADYNVPLENGRITEDYRITESLPTLQYLLKKNVKLIICSHLGRPDGRVVQSLSLKPVSNKLSELLDRPVAFSNKCVGDEVKKLVAKLRPGDVLLLENLRFHAEEEDDDKDFAKELASLADVFVQDAFGAAHRAHASTDAITKFIPSVAGLLLEKEVDALTNVMYEPKRPFTVIVGGAKIQDKLEIIKHFITKADFLAVGGALANAFLAAKRVDIEESLYERGEITDAKEIIELAETEAKKRPFILAVPHDSVVASKIDKTAHTRLVDYTTNSYADVSFYPGRVPKEVSQLKAHEKILDIGPFSSSFIAGAVQLSNTVLWNGTMGVTEIDGLQGPIGPFSHGTQTIIEALVGDFGHRPYTVVGGGDTTAYLEARGLLRSFDHVSTGGGASLDLLSGRKLPGVESLKSKK